MTAPIVVVGGGLAAGTAVTTLREEGYDGDVVLFAEEPHPPYERPPLSKAYLMGKQPAEKALVHERSWYADNGVDLRTTTPVTRIDPDAHTVRAGDADTGYARLLLATGAIPRRLGMVDDSGVPATYLRTLEDSTALRDRLHPGRRIAIIGGGWIGLEVAAAAREAGAEVVVLEALDLPLLRVLGSEVATSFASLHREHGVDLRTGVGVESIEPHGSGVRLGLADGDTLDADHLVVGVGVSPSTQLAEAAGLDVAGSDAGGGILVDSGLRTSAPDVFAAGDVANVDHPVLGRRLRVEHWDTALQHGKVAGTNLAGGEAAADALPYFFTDQYDLGMEYVGNAGPDDYDRVVVRGNLDGDRVFSAFWLSGHRVLAGMHANDWDAIDPIRALVGSSVDPDRLADQAVALADVPDGAAQE
ncbi:MAG: NAD(P)/FAD-dependent oxidoreductase [Marmoricola sp.]